MGSNRLNWELTPDFYGTESQMTSGDPDKANSNDDNDETLGPEDSKPLEGSEPEPNRTLGPGFSGDSGRTVGMDATIGPTDLNPATTSGEDATLFVPGDSGDGHRRPAANRKIDIQGYEILDELGRGGMGVVYKARDKALNRIVALKMILAGVHASDESIARFRIEAEAVAQLQHRGIVQVYDVGQSDGQPWCALEYIDGGGLDELMAREKLSTGDAVNIVEELALAMSSAHQAGIVHRDLKPANVLISKGGTSGSSINAESLGKYRPKITDFGLAKKVEQDSGQTQTGAIMGTPAYMAPEQARGAKRIGPAADIYSLGAILYQLVSGRAPFCGDTPIKTIMQVLNVPAVSPRSINPAIDRDLDTIILKCLEKEPAARYASAEHLAQDLHRYQTGMPIEARPVSGIERIGKWARRKPWAAAMIVLGSLGLTAVIVGGAIFNRQLSAAYIQIDKEHDVAVLALEEKSRALDAESRALDAETAALVESDAALTRAEASDAANRRRLIDNYVNNALQAMNNNQMLQALPWLSESLSLETDPDRKPIHQTRFNLALQAAPKPQRTWLSDAAIVACHFSEDGNQIATVSSDRLIRIYDIPSNKVIHQLESPSQITGFRISPDHHQAVVISMHLNVAEGDFSTLNYEVQLWDIVNDTLSDPVRLTASVPLNLQPRVFAEQGWFANSNTENRSLDLVDLKTGEIVRSFQLEDTDSRIGISSSGHFVAIMSEATLTVWNADNELTPVVEIGIAATDPLENSFHFENDDRLVFVGKEIGVFDLSNGKRLTSFARTGKGIPHVALSLGDTGLAVAWPNGQMEIFEFDGTPTDKQDIRSQMVRLFYSADGKTLFAAIRFEVIKYDAATGAQLDSPIPSTLKPLQYADLRSDDKVLAICSGIGLFQGSGCLRLWEVADKSSVTPLFIDDPNQKIGTLIPGSDGDYVAVVSGEKKQLTMVDVSNRDRPKTILQLFETGVDQPDIKSFSWSPDGSRFSVSLSNDQIKVFGFPNGEEICQCALDSPSGSVFNSDSSQLAVRIGDDNNMVALIDALNGKLLQNGLKHKRTVQTVNFVDNDRGLATISSDLNYRLFDVESGERIEKNNLRMVPASSRFDRQDKLFVIGGERLGDMPGRLGVFDCVTGESVADPLDYESVVTKVRFSQDGKIIALADSNGVVRIVNTANVSDTGFQMTHPDDVVHLEFSHDNQLLLTVCKDHQIRLFDVSSGVPIAPAVGSSSAGTGGIQYATFLGDTYDVLELTDRALIWQIRNRSFTAEHASTLSRFLTGSVISERGTIVPSSSSSLKEDFSNVTIRQIMDANLIRHLLPN